MVNVIVNDIVEDKKIMKKIMDNDSVYDRLEKAKRYAIGKAREYKTRLSCSDLETVGWRVIRVKMDF